MKKINGLLGIAATALISMSSAQATVIGLFTDGSINLAENNINIVASSGLLTPTDGADSVLTLSAASFNAMSVADLISTYDTLVIPWQINPTANLDWTTVLLPYMNGGGSVLWEDPLNISDLDDSGVELTSSTAIYPGIGEGDISLVPPFSDAGAVGYYHIHYGILSASSDWDVWSTDINGGIHGVYGEFGDNGGRMVIGVSDNLYHPDFANAEQADHYALTVNELNWLNTGSITGIPDDPDDPDPVPTPSALLLLGMGLLGVARARRK